MQKSMIRSNSTARQLESPPRRYRSRGYTKMRVNETSSSFPSRGYHKKSRESVDESIN